MSTAGRKLFVGSLPPGVTDPDIRAQFSRFGTVEDVFIKPNCEAGRQWAFVTMSAPYEAQSAKEQCDRILVFPGAERPCDVMVAKNQGMFGQQGDGPPSPMHAGSGQVVYPSNGQYAVGSGMQATPQLSTAAPVKIFVGSLPDGITDAVLRTEYSKYGNITDIFVKPGCEPGRQWAFISFTTPEEAQYAQDVTNGTLQFPGQLRACEVTMARNQGQFGSDPISHGPPRPGEVDRYGASPNTGAPKKVFVGSLPAHITREELEGEFGKYGLITDIHINNKPCESGRQWAFITFTGPEEASHAKVSTDRVLIFPGAEKPCEVTLARHQGMFGQESIVSDRSSGGHGYDQYGSTPSAPAPKKIFVGSLPIGIDDAMIRYEFSKYGQITDIHINSKPCEPGRNWAFVTFASPDQAQYAKDCTDRLLTMPGGDKVCEVMLAKNQGKFGQDSNSMGGPSAHHAPQGHGHQGKGQGYHHTPHVVPALHPAPAAGPPGHQPPPPTAPPPSHLTPWRMYKTAAGLPYYHNHQTNVTQWECPPELQVPGQTSAYPIPSPDGKGHHGSRYAPY